MGTSKLRDEGYQCDGLASNPGGSGNTPSCFELLKSEISSACQAT